MTDSLCTEEMTGAPLKQPNDYVFVELEAKRLKHMFGGDQPALGDFTICGQKILGLTAETFSRARSVGTRPTP